MNSKGESLRCSTSTWKEARVERCRDFAYHSRNRAIAGVGMSSTAISSIVFGSVFGGALLGMFFQSVLPPHHLNDKSKDVVKLGMALVASMSALVLSLLISSGKTSYDAQSNELRAVSSDI